VASSFVQKKRAFIKQPSDTKVLFSLSLKKNGHFREKNFTKNLDLLCLANFITHGYFNLANFWGGTF
jgi:hypothetical protein